MNPVQIILFIKIGVLGLFLGGAYVTGHHMGANAVQADWNASKAQFADAQSKLIAAHAVEIEELRKKQDLNNVQVAEDHERALNEIAKKHDDDLARVRASGGLRVPRSICTGPAVTGTQTPSDSGRNEDLAGTVQLPDEITSNLFAEAKRADEITEQARACQAWIRKNGFYGSESDHRILNQALQAVPSP